MQEVSLPATLEDIDNCAFADCVSLTALSYPEGLTRIGRNAFEGCTGLLEAKLPDSVTTIGEQAFMNCTSLAEFRYPKSWSEVDGYASGLTHGETFAGCESLTYVEVPEGVTTIPAYAFEGANYLNEVDVPSSLTTIENYAFRECETLRKVYLSPNVTSIGKGTFSDCPNLKIYCEYGSYALQYAKDNGIAYFYLTLVGASIPRGTLYKGDDFVLYGYVRSSDPIQTLSGGIYSADTKELLQQIDLQPGVTDYNLNGRYNAALKFGALALGDYEYEIAASAGGESEVFARTSFEIAPPPPRVYISGLKLPEGVQQMGEALTLGGTVNANYNIAQLSVEVYDATTNVCVLNYTTQPNATSFNLSMAAASLDTAALPAGSYVLKTKVVVNGVAFWPAESSFSMGDYDGSIDEEIYQSVVAFAKDANNRTVFMEDVSNSILGRMDAETILLMMLNSGKDHAIGMIEGLLQANPGLNVYQAELYRKEILSTIAAMEDDPWMLEESKTVKESKIWVDTILEFGSVSIELIKEKGGTISAEMESLLGVFNEGIETLKFAGFSFETAYETIIRIYQIYATVENGLVVINAVADSMGIYNNEEFTKAVETLRNEYIGAKCGTISDLFGRIFEEFLKHGAEEAVKTLLDKAISAPTLKVVFFALELSMRLSGYSATAEGYQDFLTRKELYSVALETYSSAFVKVHEGDVSGGAVRQLYLVFLYTKQTTLRLCDTMLAMDTLITEEEKTEVHALMDRINGIDIG